MNQSELIEKVAQATELNQATVGQAVKAVVNAVLDALLAGEAVRVSGLGVFNVAARPAREGRNPRTGESIEIAASKAVRFHAGKAVKDALNPPNPKVASRKKTPPTKKSAARKQTSSRCAGGTDRGKFLATRYCTGQQPGEVSPRLCQVYVLRHQEGYIPDRDLRLSE